MKARHDPVVLAHLEDDRLVLRCRGRKQVFTFSADEDIPAGLFVKWLRPDLRPDPCDIGYRPYSPNKAALRKAQIEQGLALAEKWMETHEVTKGKPAKRTPPAGISLEDLGL